MADVLVRNHVVIRGRGQPMLLAHGYGCDQNMWRHVAAAFAGDYRVVLFDHVGAGRSDLAQYDEGKYATLDGYANDVLEICDALALRDVVFVGHSVSAMIGVLAAARRPELFAHLVLVGPSARYIDDDGYVGGFARDDIDKLLDQLDSNHLGWSRAMAPVIMGNADRPALAEELAESFCRADPAIAKAFARVTFLSDNRDDLARVVTPALVLQCSHDVIAPETAGRFVHERLRGSRFTQLKATGHCPNLSAPDETVTAIKAYLASARCPVA
ncbi:MAG TPA: alpha/beta hydrolase [Planctomycetota bacterium]|nr:alpha/beta hydrolase [Planctomycetota bacterium]